ncbi:MAG: hypothetical protein M3N47_05755 [Chloroflexota bacterium]|nr:hypothetical protein [Chloroflexota bacterium]
MAQSALPEDQQRAGSQAGALPERHDEPGRAKPLEAVGSRGEWSSKAPAQHPFAFQHRHQLFLLDGGAGDWVLAELRFERATCRYVEVRRASYHWPREALSSLLSRMITGERDDEDVLDQATASFAHWLSGQFQTHH